jgi:hypothetical protein
MWKVQVPPGRVGNKTPTFRMSDIFLLNCPQTFKQKDREMNSKVSELFLVNPVSQNC